MLSPELLKHVKNYQKYAPIKLKAYAVNVLKYES